MTRVMRIGGKFAKKLEWLQGEYSRSLGKPIKMTRLTDEMAESLESNGMFNFWFNDAMKKRRRRKK